MADVKVMVYRDGPPLPPRVAAVEKAFIKAYVAAMDVYLDADDDGHDEEMFMLLDLVLVSCAAFYCATECDTKADRRELCARFLEALESQQGNRREPLDISLTINEQEAHMTFEVGKRYKTRDGREAGPLLSYTGVYKHKYAFEGTLGLRRNTVGWPMVVGITLAANLIWTSSLALLRMSRSRK